MGPRGRDDIVENSGERHLRGRCCELRERESTAKLENSSIAPGTNFDNARPNSRHPGVPVQRGTKVRPGNLNRSGCGRSNTEMTSVESANTRIQCSVKPTRRSRKLSKSSSTRQRREVLPSQPHSTVHISSRLSVQHPINSPYKENECEQCPTTSSSAQATAQQQLAAYHQFYEGPGEQFDTPASRPQPLAGAVSDSLYPRRYWGQSASRERWCRLRRKVRRGAPSTSRSRGREGRGKGGRVMKPGE